MSRTVVVEVEWRVVHRWTGLYEVSNDGRVRRAGIASGATVGRVLSPLLDRRGYHKVCLVGGGRKEYRLVHRLVAEAFIGRRPDGMEVNHIDADKDNNAAANLEYLTPTENREHAKRLGRYQGPRPATKAGESCAQ